jgi:hypothetical protein
MEVVARCRDTALRYARRRPMIVVGLGEHHLSPGYRGRPPRSHLERVKRGNPVWVQSGHRGRAPGRAKDDQKANAGGGNAAGNRDVLISALLLMISDNRPDIGPGAWA